MFDLNDLRPELQGQIQQFEARIVELQKAEQERDVLRAKLAALVEAGRDTLGVVQASLVNARERNEYPAIIANLEYKEANLRAAIEAVEGGAQ